MMIMMLLMMIMMMIMMVTTMMTKIKCDVQVQDITHVTWRKGGEVLDLHSEERVR